MPPPPPIPCPDADPALLDDPARLRALHDLEVLDSPPEAAFDALVQVAATACGTPISLISLVDERRQWFKANVGVPGVTEGPRDDALCARTVSHGAFLELPDASADPRFVARPVRLGDAPVVFYAACPIRLSDGHVVGAICVIDRSPRRLDERQRETLAHLAVVAAQALEGRRAALSAHRRAAELETSEARFRTLSEGAPLGVFHTDAAGACTYTNPRWQEIYGLSLAESLGDGWSRALHPDDRDAVFGAWSSAASGAPSEFDREFRILRSDGSTRRVRARARAVVAVTGEVTGYVGSVEDVTRRHQLEAFLAHAGRLAGVGGWELDLTTQSLTWSDQTRRIHEVDADYRPTVDSAIAFYAPEARAAIAGAVQTGIDEGRPWDLELPMITATGRAIWVRAMGQAEFEGGKAVRLIGAFRDITETHRRRLAFAEEQLLRQQVQEHARATERLLQERSEMLDILAHEVRQPLNNASAALQSAAASLSGTGAAGDAPASPRLARAQAVLSTVLGSIDNTLAVAALLAHPDAIARDDTDIDAMLALCLAEVPAAERHRVEVERQTRLRTASMDMSLIRLALRNLLSNALRYGTPGSRVRLVLADCDEPLGLIVDVVDEGPGFPESVLGRLFERGASGSAAAAGAVSRAADRGLRGLGMGLYIVRRVMELHGGSIALVRNGPDGATMRLTLAQPVGD